MNTIFAKLLYLIEKNIDTMLVTIVSHQGSAPRGTGSQMLVEPHGRVLGTIGGGPGEKEAEALALESAAESEELQALLLEREEIAKHVMTSPSSSDPMTIIIILIVVSGAALAAMTVISVIQKNKKK